MVKITKSSLAQLAQEMHVLVGQEQKECVGGANSTYSQFGSSLKEARLEDFASVQNPLSTQIGETESPYASTMLFEAEDTQRQHDIFATAFIEELDSAVSTSGGIGVADVDESGFGGIGSGLIGSGGIGSGGVGTGDIDDDREKLRIGSQIGKGIHMDKTITDNPALSNQMARLFESSELKGILSPFLRGNEHVTFKVGNTVNSDAGFETSYGENRNLVITIRQDLVNHNGFYQAGDGYDNAGYWHSKNPIETLAVLIAHEATHAKHMFIGDDAMRHCYNNASEAAAFVAKNYSPGLRDVLFKQENGVWIKRSLEDYETQEHKYMKQYNHESFRKVYQQYK